MSPFVRSSFVMCLALTGTLLLSAPSIANGETGWAGVAKLAAADGATGDLFGHSVALFENTAIVGAWGDDDLGDFSGAAYLFERDEQGAWVEIQKLLASDGVGAEDFGAAVALSADVAAVGACHDDDNGGNSGSVYLFERGENGVWTEGQKLLASDGNPGDNFGCAIAISRDTLVVGAPLDSDTQSFAGAVYVFSREWDGVWVEKQKIVASDGGFLHQLGGSVAVYGDTILAGADGDDELGLASGSAYLFERDADGYWLEAQKLLAPDGVGGDAFGVSVALSSDIAAIGAHLDDDAGLESGSVYLFFRSPEDGWSAGQKLTPSDGDLEPFFFGESVAIGRRALVVGASGSFGARGATGAAYLFEREPGGSWFEADRLQPFDGSPGDSFGGFVALSRGVTVIGSRSSDTEIDAAAGAAYVFER